jgi:hypothetical protein
MASNDYGATYQQGQPNLDIPGAAPTNPFRQEAAAPAYGQQYNNYASQQDQYSVR